MKSVLWLCRIEKYTEMIFLSLLRVRLHGIIHDLPPELVYVNVTYLA